MLTFGKLKRSRIRQSDPAPYDKLNENEKIISIEQFFGSCSHPVVEMRTYGNGLPFLQALPNDTFFLMEVVTDAKVLADEAGDHLDPEAVFENVTKRIWMTKSEIADTGLWDVHEFQRHLKNFRRSEVRAINREVEEFARHFQKKKQQTLEAPSTSGASTSDDPPRVAP